jgi:uncharacterized protein (DUF433 family)
MTAGVIDAVYEGGVLRPLKPLRLAERAVVQLEVRPRTGEVAHRYVTRDADSCGGRPTIRGTRVLVQTIVGYYKLGLTVDEMLAGLPHLTAAQVFDALSYYHDHQAEIEAEIAAAEPEPLLARYGLRREADGRVVPGE